MIRRPIVTTDAPGAIGPYSQGVRAGGLFYTSGQLPLTPSGDMIRDDIPRATRQALENVRAILAAGGATMKDVALYVIENHYGRLMESADLVRAWERVT